MGNGMKAIVAAVVAASVATWLTPGEQEWSELAQRAAIMVPTMWGAFALESRLGGCWRR